MKTDTKYRVGLSFAAIVWCVYTFALVRFFFFSEAKGQDSNAIFYATPPPVVEMADSGRPGDPDIWVDGVPFNPPPPEPRLIVVDDPTRRDPLVFVDDGVDQHYLVDREYYMPPQIEIHYNQSMGENPDNIWPDHLLFDGEEITDPDMVLFILLVVYIMSAFDDPDFEWEEEDDGQ